MDLTQEKEKLNTAKERLGLGLPPTENIEQEFERTIYDTQRRQEMLETRKLALENHRNDPTVVTRTTAEQRPNAYIPDGDIMLPKPYGAHPPLKPTSENNNAYRFFKRPKVEEISFD